MKNEDTKNSEKVQKYHYAQEGQEDLIRESAVEYQTTHEKNEYTIEDYLALPEDVRVELIDGQFFEMFAPTLSHQAVSMELSAAIWNFIRKKKGGCVVFAAPVDVQLDMDERTMVQPDVLVVCDREKMTGERIMGAPDFIIEILSPSTKGKDMFLKLMKYKNAGVREYWMIDIGKGRVITYYFEEDDIPVIYGMDQKVPVKIFQGELVIDFSEVRDAAEENGGQQEEKEVRGDFS